MKKLKYLLFIFIILISHNVFAAETNVSNKIRYAVDESGGTYFGNNIANGTSRDYSVGTRYNGRLSYLSFYISSDDYEFLINHTYSITLNMATQDWRNHFMGPQVIKANLNGSLINTNGSLSVSNFRFISYKQIKFNFTTNNSISPFYFFRLYSSDYATNNTIAITGDNNWALSSVIINDQVSISGSGSSGSSGAGSSITNNTLSCNDGLTITSTTYNDSNANITGSYINSSGSLVSNSSYNVINYIPIKPNTNYQIKKTTSTGDVPSYCLSSSTSSYGSCTAYNANSTFTFNSGNNSYLSISVKSDETIYLSFCASSIEIDNQNTQNIIDNANQNTTDIIDNANQNTNKIIESERACKTIDKKDIREDGLFLTNSGGYYLNSGYGITDYIDLKDSTVSIYSPYTQTGANIFLCYYNDEKEKISCENIHNVTTLNVPSNARFFRSSILKSANRPILEYCRNGNQALNDSINDTNNYLKDDSDPNIADSEFTTLFDSVSINNPVSSLLQLPVQFINAIVNQSNSCQVVSLGTLLGVAITLPCIDIGSIVGSTVWDTIDVLSSIGLIVLILKQIYESITNALTLGGYMDAKKGGLGYMPPLEFLCSILTGFGGDM